MTATKCGFGYDGECCCECALHLVAKPRCHHLGGTGPCGPVVTSKDPEVEAVAKIVARIDSELANPRRYVCLAFAHEGIAQTDWEEHGCCEMWTPRDRPAATHSLDFVDERELADLF